MITFYPKYQQLCCLFIRSLIAYAGFSMADKSAKTS